MDITVPGVEQPTAIGSCAELPLGGAFGPSFALHFWFYSSVPHWEQPQTLVAATSDEGASFALAIQKSELVISVRGRPQKLGLTVQPLLWYSVVLSVESHQGKSEVLAHIKQVKGLPGAAAVRQARAVLDGAASPFDKLLLAARAISPIGSALDGFNGKIDSLEFFDRALSERNVTRCMEAPARTRGSPGASQRIFAPSIFTNSLTVPQTASSAMAPSAR